MTLRPWHEHERGDVEGVSPRWRDIKFPASADRIDSASTRYSFDYDELTIIFDADARIANERLGHISQMNHDWEFDTNVHPHIHWYQKQAGEPNWHLKWRMYNNGEAVPDTWNELTADSPVFPYTSGTMMQITPFPLIDLEGLTISGFAEFIIGRDTGNVSGLFAGADPVDAAVEFKEFDVHALFDSRGSRQEFVK